MGAGATGALCAPPLSTLKNSDDNPQDCEQPKSEIGDTEMGLDDFTADQLQAFNEALAGSGWSARLTLPSSGHICLHIERCFEGVSDPAPHSLEFCRRTFAEAAKSARKHLHKPA